MSRSPCDECAFGKNGAGMEPYNQLRGQICVLGPIPFGCHHGLNWHDSSNWSGSEIRQALKNAGICQGWKREVARLNAEGWFGKYRVIRRAVAKNALFYVELFTAASNVGNEPQKNKYLRALKRMLKFLYSKDIENKKIPLTGDVY